VCDVIYSTTCGALLNQFCVLQRAMKPDFSSLSARWRDVYHKLDSFVPPRRAAIIIFLLMYDRMAGE